MRSLSEYVLALVIIGALLISGAQSQDSTGAATTGAENAAAGTGCPCANNAGAATAETGTAAAETAGTGTAAAETAGTGTAAAETAGTGTAAAETAGTGAAAAETAGTGSAAAATAGAETGAAETAGTGTAVPETAETGTGAPETLGTGTGAPETMGTGTGAPITGGTGAVDLGTLGTGTLLPLYTGTGGLQLLTGTANLEWITGGGATAEIAGTGGVEGITIIGGAEGITGVGGVEGITIIGGAEGITGAGGVEGITIIGGAEGITGAGGAEGITGAGGAEGITGSVVEGATGSLEVIGTGGTIGVETGTGASINMTEELELEMAWKMGMTEQLRLVVVNKLNALRGNLALGIVANGKGGTFLRKGNRLRQMRYSFDMERRAYFRAKLGAAMGPPPPGWHESCITLTAPKGKIDAILTRNMQKWWSEITMRTEPIDQVQNLWYAHMGISNWAMMASDLTTHMGCAFYKYEVNGEIKVNIVIEYRSTLTEGTKLYSTGPTCKKCEGGADTCINGLCPAEVEGVC